MTDRRPELEPLLPREPRSYDPGPEVVDAMLAELMGMTLRREPTWRERLAERSTQQRGLIVGAGLAVVSAMWLGMMGWRGDLMGVDLARYVGLSLVLVASAGFAVEGALRAVGRRALTPGLVAVGLALPVLLAALPGAWPGMRPPEGIPFDAHLMCGAMGTMLGLAYCVPMLLVQRGRPDATRLVVSRDDQPRIFDVTRRAWVAEVFGVLGSVSSPCVADDEHALYAVDDGCLLL
ncbi:MAG TPA: hypothetical protein PKA64_12345, partial [Myxococcota bacterium]|nr:hypothetical protein [Myxococcota bacterium]